MASKKDVKDVAPDLLDKIRKEFEEEYSKSEKIKIILEKVDLKRATYKEANEFAIEVSNILTKAYKNNLSSSVLPDGKMYYNIAKRVLEPTMEDTGNIIWNIAKKVQEKLNQDVGIGIKAIEPKKNTKIKGIIDRVSSEPNFDKVSWILDEPVKTLSQSIIDETIKSNAEFHHKSGMKPKIIRKVAGNCCAWCQAVAGSYSYPDVPKDVYRRHQRCRCTVDYYPGDGKVQNVYDKTWRYETQIEKRKKVGIETTTKSDKIKSGARITDTNTDYAKVWAKSYYEEIRHKSTDCQKIAKKLGYDVEEIRKVKDYLFVNKSLWDGDLGVWTRFDPDPAIAQSWQRLAEGKILSHDITLIKHELYEMEIKKMNPGITHGDAHTLASKRYNYGKEADEYYGNLRKSNKKK